jgi:putative spermidine/putrescine transport system ATP-binding protein
MSSILLEALRKSFGAKTVVDGFDLSVEEGEFVSLLGGSGCGKTTTLRMVAGLEEADSGRILIDGQDVAGVAAERRKVGMVFQHYALFPTMSVRRNIGFGLEIAGLPRAEIASRVDEMLELIDLGDHAGYYPWQLSGGQQQRVALARALAPRPRVLLLDEPLSALDARIRTRLGEDIRAIQRKMNITTLYVTHDQEEALSLSDRIVVMNEGRVEQVGSPAEIYNEPASPFVASFIGTLNILDAVVVDPGAGRVTVAGQGIAVGARIHIEAGARLRVALRPERIGLEGAGNGTPNGLRGTVTAVGFLGPIVRVAMSIGGQALRVDVLNANLAAVPREGAEAVAAFPPEACMMMD